MPAGDVLRKRVEILCAGAGAVEIDTSVVRDLAEGARVAQRNIETPSGGRPTDARERIRNIRIGSVIVKAEVDAVALSAPAPAAASSSARAGAGTARRWRRSQGLIHADVQVVAVA